MKNILSIDFDIIMEPSIQFYNNMTHITWNEIGKGNNYVDILTANYDTYHKLTKYLLSLTKKLPKEHIHFIYDHHHIVSMLDENEQYNVVNIDHHHDKGYPQREQEDILSQPLNCGNWVRFVPNLNKYTWIKNPNSISVIGENIESVPGLNIANYPLETLTIPDEVFICFSVPWIPPNHQSLFYLWMDLLNEIYHTHFDFEQPNG